VNRSRRALILFIALVLTMSFAVPAEDVSETAYDESASLPYVSTCVISIAGREPVVEASVVSSAVPECIAEAPAAPPYTSRLRLGFLRRPSELRDHRTAWADRVPDSFPILNHSLRC
jgi:hypothetical protein